MAAANVLTTGSGAASSSEVVLTTATAFGLKGYDKDSVVEVLLKDDGGALRPVGTLTHGAASRQITTPGTYVFRRPASSSACGVFSG